MTEFRHELKHEIGAPELLALRQRLSAVLAPDRHSDSGRYTVRSLYFDDARDSALREKLDGVGSRQKFRLRLYNSDPSLIKLEKKIKRNGLCSNLTEPMEAAAVSALLSGASWEPSGPLAEELHARMSSVPGRSWTTPARPSPSLPGTYASRSTTTSAPASTAPPCWIPAV